MNHYDWDVVAAYPGSNAGEFAQNIKNALKSLEDSGYEIDDMLDAPGGRDFGVVVVGKRPKRIPAT
jgi:hypothetical protein